MRLLVIAFQTILLGNLSVTQPELAAQEKLIRIAIPSLSIQEIPLVIAQKRGLFATQGLSVELIQIAGSPATAALIAG